MRADLRTLARDWLNATAHTRCSAKRPHDVDGLEFLLRDVRREAFNDAAKTIAAEMRTDFPENRHAREWADHIERRDWRPEK